jgi:biotin-(acetyl-CoA carboxylase) ligase
MAERPALPDWREARRHPDRDARAARRRRCSHRHRRQLSAATDPRVRRRTASLEELVRPLPPRNLLIGRITCELLQVLESFDVSGLALLRGEWESLHAHAGHRIRLRLADGSVVSGIHTGVAEDGALRVRTREGVRALHSARVLSARPA